MQQWCQVWKVKCSCTDSSGVPRPVSLKREYTIKKIKYEEHFKLASCKQSRMRNDREQIVKTASTFRICKSKSEMPETSLKLTQKPPPIKPKWAHHRIIDQTSFLFFFNKGKWKDYYHYHTTRSWFIPDSSHCFSYSNIRMRRSMPSQWFNTFAILYSFYFLEDIFFWRHCWCHGTSWVRVIWHDYLKTMWSQKAIKAKTINVQIDGNLWRYSWLPSLRPFGCTL